MFYRLLLIVSLAALGSQSQPAIAEARPGAEMPAQAASAVLPDPTADRVLGQAAFNTNGSGTSSTAMWLPAGIAIAPAFAPNAGRLFVVEYGDLATGNHRVLSWDSTYSFLTGQSADLVIGQEDYTTRGGGLAKDRFYGPEAAVVDAGGSLWVADTENNRVLRFDPPFNIGMDASLVLGQPDYLHNDPNQDPIQIGDAAAANTLFYPRGLAMDAAGNLYVADDANHRVLRFSPPFSDDMPASLVIGQVNYEDNDANRGGGAATQNTLNRPKGIAVDAAGNLYVADYENNRMLRFAPPLSDGMNASQVLGQLDYLHNDPNRAGGNPAANTLYHPVDIAVSAVGDALFVTDQGNVRVLSYNNPLGDTSGDAFADQVYGQPDFTSYPPNTGVSKSLINVEPLGVAVDANGSLYHADFRNNRLLAYDVEMVGDGPSISCTEANFDAALAGGGTIAFNCGASQIDLSIAKYITEDTTIDGRGMITLSGQGANRLFYVNPGVSLTLRNITLTGGYSSGDGGAIYNEEGTLVLENSTVRDSTAAGSGGAVVNYGSLTIIDSLLEGNQALNGGALYPRWGISQTRIVNSVIRNNHATDTTDGWGGAILVWDGAIVSIESSEIYGNTAKDGGGIYNDTNSSLYLFGNTMLRDNIAASDGGGLYNPGDAFLRDVTLSGNYAASAGGGIYNEGTVMLIDDTLSGNIADDGGGLYSYSGTATLTNVTLSGNSAEYGSGIFNNATATLTNSTLSGNSAVSYGGGLYNDGTATLTNATLSDNSAPIGGGIYNDVGATATFKNSIIAYSPNGGNCRGVPLTNNNSDKYSLSSDGTCALAGTGSMNSVDPLLSALGNYGGPTLVHMLKLGSPAIDGVAGSDAPTNDQRDLPRPQGNGYDIGAVERQPTDSDLQSRAYLPMLIK